MRLTFKLENLPRHAAGRKPGFLRAIQAAATIKGDEISIDDAAWRQLAKEYRAKEAAPTRSNSDCGPAPAPALLAADYEAATAPWSARGRPVLSVGDFTARLAACTGCEWSSTRGDQQRCEHPARPCSTLFAWLPHETCRLARWPAPPPPPVKTEHLRQRAANYQKLHDSLADQIAATEARLETLKQRKHMFAGRLQEVSSLLAEEPPSAPTKETKRPA